MRSALILGGTGQIGRAAARTLVERGWDVTIAARGTATLPDGLAAAGVRGVALDRSAPGALEAALGDGVDVLVDVIAMTEADARQLVSVADRIGSIVAISSASVYCDDEGRTIDEATGEDDFPRLDGPISERQRTVDPSDATYSTRKVAMEQTLLGADRLRATIVRPCAIHGPGGKNLREIHFVKRALDGRRAIVLARRGGARFHTTSVANLAELIRLVAERPATRIVNCGDPHTPTVLEIARAVAAVLGHEWTEILLPGPEQGTVGDHPWNAPRPFVIDMTTAEIDLGYRPVTTYERAVEDTVHWIVDALREGDWNDLVTREGYLEKLFDYEAEDEYLRGLAAAPL